MRLILLDTNFWLMPFESGVDILTQLERLSDDAAYQIGLPQSIKAELDSMASSPASRKRTRAARSAVRVVEQLMGEGKVKLLASCGPADGSLITLALQTGAWVATNHRALRLRLRAKKVRVIVMRDDRMLSFV